MAGSPGTGEPGLKGELVSRAKGFSILSGVAWRLLELPIVYGVDGVRGTYGSGFRVPGFFKSCGLGFRMQGQGGGLTTV